MFGFSPADLLLNAIHTLLIEAQHHVHSGRKDRKTQQQSSRRRIEVRFPAVQFFLLADGAGQQNNFKRAADNVADTHSDQFLEHRRNSLQFLAVDSGTDIDRTERIEVLHRNIEFFLEEIRHIHHT